MHRVQRVKLTAFPVTATLIMVEVDTVKLRIRIMLFMFGGNSIVRNYALFVNFVDEYSVVRPGLGGDYTASSTV